VAFTAFLFFYPTMVLSTLMPPWLCLLPLWVCLLLILLLMVSSSLVPRDVLRVTCRLL
jgi:hypothetical protein